MAVYPLKNNEFVSVEELDMVLTICSELQNQVVTIRFEEAVDSIDIVFVGGLFLLYRQKGLKFMLSGVCGPYHDMVFDPFSGNGFHAYFQYLNQINELYAPEVDWLDTSRNNDYVTKSKVESAAVYAPVLFIDDKSFESFFDEKGADLGGYKESYLNGLIKRTQNDSAKAYFARSGNVTDDLRAKPAIETFVFNMMYSISDPFVIPKEQGKPRQSTRTKRRQKVNPRDKIVTEMAEKAISEIMDFVEQFVGGLKELAKNIITHSEFKMGIITLRAYQENAKDKDAVRNLETFVFDFGTIGIIPQMTADLQNQADRTAEDNEDLDLLSSKEYRLADLMERSDKLLFRQIHREMAHLGLIHFASLIRSRNGHYSVSTASFDGERESLGENALERNLAHGTNFHFTLPLQKEKHFQSNNTIGANGASEEQIMAMSELLKNKGFVQIVPLQRQIVRTREDEILLVQKAAAAQEDTKFYAVDFSDVEIDSATSLLRVLALFSKRIECGLIVYNIETKTFCEMLNVNELYFRRLKDYKDIGYWLKGKSVLVYSHLGMLEPNEENDLQQEEEVQDDSIVRRQFFFADLLFGQTKDEFAGVNRSISYVFPNFVTLSLPPNTQKDRTKEFVKEAPVSQFFSGQSLMPFDIILNAVKEEDGKEEDETAYSIFLSNLDYLLNKKIDEHVQDR